MIRLAIRVQSAHAEVVLAELLEIAPGGIEEKQLESGDVEYAVYGSPGELPSLPDLKAAAGDSLVEISTSETADDWQERWREFHRPIVVRAARREAGDEALGSVAAAGAPDTNDDAIDGGLAFYVRPPWEPAGAEPGMQEIVIDPGQAFGTGAHATTRMCLELLLEIAAEPARGPSIDVGSGSGVLAIAAARLGFAPVRALDYERESVRAAQENAAVNGAQIAVERFDLRSEPLVVEPGAIVLANLLLPLLLDLSRSIEGRPRALVASGLLRDQADRAAEAFAERLGLRERRRLQHGEWAALWLA